jgi:hypothetical protein
MSRISLRWSVAVAVSALVAALVGMPSASAMPAAPSQLGSQNVQGEAEALATCTSINLQRLAPAVSRVGPQGYAWGRVKAVSPGGCVGRIVRIYLAEEYRGGGYAWRGGADSRIDSDVGAIYTSYKVFFDCRNYDLTRFTGYARSAFRVLPSGGFSVGSYRSRICPV